MSILGPTPKFDIAKLPKWAQQRIECLEMELEVKRKALKDEHRGTSGTAFIEVFDGNHDYDLVPLCSDTVVFKVEGGTIHCRVDKHRDLLEVRSNEGKWIYVRPSVANTIFVNVTSDD